MDENERFVVQGQQGGLRGMLVIVDSQTGVNYLFVKAGNAGGLTPLLGADGNPIVTPLEARE